MRHISRRLATTALLTATGLIAPAAPLALADPTPGTTGPSVLVLTVTPGTPDAPGVGHSAVLQCGDKPGGTHPTPAAACAALRADGLDFTSRPTVQIMCPDIVRPVTVAATGVWDGTPVDYQHTYTNECLMQRATGVLFAL
ncbi:SSI family serine proteinase inhibitor [Streptacidiphilus neutrinimicus]|uniref:SSI family serine proteinase inhibitor n=1 Tax=Streptacidiphilus neutrinimicus TaxID=105420 RepID=UPI0005A789DE|nr:SSI family serine proteinase inhibitor [Streptacidiphilus neutrinimicus]